MSTPFYTKVVQGVVEQVYGSDGYCISQKFVAFEGDCDRRLIAPETEGDDEGLENDEVIEHPEDLKYIMSIEKFQDTDMVQPKLPAA